MIDKHECRQIGIIVKTHGIKGELVVRLFDEFNIDHLDTEFLFIELDGGLVPFFLEEAREKNKTDVLVKLELAKEESEIERLIDGRVYVKKGTVDETADDEAFSAYQLVGYSVQAIGIGPLGKIVAIKDISKNPLFEIEFEGREILVPIVEDFIVNIDDENEVIIFELPEGLIDLD
nr:ribosome maturation factor RimM [uncultured Carboxylicivirga sp.]